MKYAYAMGRLTQAMRLAATDLEYGVAPGTVAVNLRRTLEQVERELAEGGPQTPMNKFEEALKNAELPKTLAGP